MRPLTPDDLLPLDEYASRRREFFDSHRRYLDRYRRVRLGPRLTLIFENRQTIWFRVQELLRIARLADPARVRRELQLCNRLLPSRDCLQAALLIEVGEEARWTEELANWQTLEGEELTLCVGSHRSPAQLLTCRPEDRCVGAAHWVRFCCDAAARKLLARLELPAYCSIEHGSYAHESGPLSDDVRQSLLDDLALSDRDELAG